MFSYYINNMFMETKMKLDECRIDKGQTVLEASSELKITVQSYHNYERGNRTPKPDVMERIHKWSAGRVSANDFHNQTPVYGAPPSAAE